jgi:hypothetical protein
MKAATVVFALLVMCGSAYADPCGGSNCKSEDTPPVDQPAAPAVSPAAPVRTAEPCGSTVGRSSSGGASRSGTECSGRKSEDTRPADQSAGPAPFILYLPLPPVR